jgi:hypothetical protein
MLLLVPLLASCSKPEATGTANSILFASTPDIWTAVERTFKADIVPSFATLRGDPAFEVTHQDPSAETWAEARVAREIVLVGAATDAWMEPVLADQDSVPPAPAMIQVEDLWAKGQRVTLLILADASDTGAARGAMRPLSELIARQYREGAVQRLYVNGVDAELGRNLRSQVGFGMQIPVDFETSTKDSIHVFNIGTDSSEVFLEVTVTWKSPPPPDLYGEGLLQWRRETGRAVHGYSQSVNDASPEVNPVRWGNPANSGFEMQSTWRNPSNATRQGSGPFIMRVVHCPEQDRLYMVDGWVHAPALRRYEGLIQIETMLNTFSCVQ